jgi:hypothetical protein
MPNHSFERDAQKAARPSSCPFAVGIGKRYSDHHRKNFKEDSGVPHLRVLKSMD